MRTFDAALPRSLFLTAVVVPPVVFFLLVQGWAVGIEHGHLGLRSTLSLLALAQLLPLGALLGILFSTAAYTVGEGKLVVHSVMADREIPLSSLQEPPELRDGVVTLRLPRRMKIRVAQVQDCWDLLNRELAAARLSSGASATAP